MKISRLFFLAVFCLALIFNLCRPLTSAGAQAAGGLDIQAVDRSLQAQVSANRHPGLAVAIVQGDQVIFQKGYGEAAPGRPITPQTQFYIGSVTKSFTALAVLQLVEQGKLELDAPVQKYLPWFQVADPQASSRITLRNLLNHTSGLSGAGDPHAAAYTASLAEQARLLRQARLTAPVGSRFQYYNQNYRLLGLLIEQASGQSYGDTLKARIFTPLGMAHSAVHPADVPALAQGYSRVFGFPLSQSQGYIPGALPSGYLISTAEDLGRYLLAQLNNRQADGRQLLQPALLAEMRTPPAGTGSEYGMGWMVLENGNLLAHGGSLDYFQSFVAIKLKEKTGFALLFNQNSLETMYVENAAVRDGLLNLVNGNAAQPVSYGWIGWALLALAAADLFNQARLFVLLPRWREKIARQSRRWLWIRVLAGILIPLGVILGPPLATYALQGGSPTWEEPLRLMPDLTAWLLLGMGLDLVRNAIRAFWLMNDKLQRNMGEHADHQPQQTQNLVEDEALRLALAEREKQAGLSKDANGHRIRT